MATARDIVTRALKRANIIDATEQPSSSEAVDGLAALNAMMYAWANYSVPAHHADLALTDTWGMFVPPKPAFETSYDEERIKLALHKLSYRGTWNASTNSPALTSSTGTAGYLYKVSTAGSTTLDDTTSWTAGDYLMFDDDKWRKGQSSAKHEAGIIAMLAVRLCEDYGKAPTPVIARDADAGWNGILADFILPGNVQFDRGVQQVPSQRYGYYY